MGNSPADQTGGTQADQLQAAATQPGELAPQEFAATQFGANSEHGNDWWSESTDGQCSETAALFAASQPAPLSIV